MNCLWCRKNKLFCSAVTDTVVKFSLFVVQKLHMCVCAKYIYKVMKSLAYMARNIFVRTSRKIVKWTFMFQVSLPTSSLCTDGNLVISRLEDVCNNSHLVMLPVAYSVIVETLTHSLGCVVILNLLGIDRETFL